ncbi:MAG: RNA 2',3'-cyclic phosphodiesterase [Bacillota bacterium]|jgi:2'-5' RNA ligase
MRAFIAITLSQEIISNLKNWIECQDDSPWIKWTRPENLHLTIKFLGDINVNQLNNIKLLLLNICNRHKAFALNIQNIGAFPNYQKPRIIWAGISPTRSLFSLASEISSSITIGDSKEFHPHITLARLKEKHHYKMQFQNNIHFGKMNVCSINIIQSDLTPSGPIYKKIFLCKLRS